MLCSPIPPQYFGIHLKMLSHAYRRCFESTAQKNGLDELTISHGRIIGFLYANLGSDIYQRDLEEAFHITRSSVAGIVKLMEQKGYILRERVESDARLKKISLTPLGQEMQERAMAAFDYVETLATQNFTQEEIETLYALIQRLQKNLTAKKE